MFDIAPDAENSPFAVQSPRNGDNLATMNRGRGSVEMKKAKMSQQQEHSPEKPNDNAGCHREG